MTHSAITEPICIHCGDTYTQARSNAGYDTCLVCGDKAAVAARQSWTVAPLHKSNYMLITNRDDLKGINNKGGLIKHQR